LAGALENEQQRAELVRAALGVNVQNQDIASRASQSIAGAGGGAVGALSQMMNTQQQPGSFSGPVPSYEPPVGNADEWGNPYA
jgi:hypothetical protein